MSLQIWWIRRDLRLTDNPALAAALAAGGPVLPVFIVDAAIIQGRWASPRRQSFLWEGLRSLAGDIAGRGGRLVVRQGAPQEVLPALLAESGAEAIFAEADFSPYAQKRDTQIQQTLPLRLVGGSSLRHPEMVLKDNGQPYTIFTPFSRKWRSIPLPGPAALLPAPQHIATPADISSDPIPANPVDLAGLTFPVGEAEAQRRLAAFASGSQAPIYAYAELRDRPDLEGTASLSPYLRFGMLSARQAILQAQAAIQAAPAEAARKSAETWLNELIWREFYISISYHFPFVLTTSFRPELRTIAWRNDRAEFAAWCQGQTGYPIVDAAMRQLMQTGWMHNRARMIVASFLTKDLLIDWRWGESWFMQQLLDGDPAANNGGWQWSAGTGTDAAPYFRIFNPILQGQKFDPQGSYVRRWVPELANVPNKSIHSPWQMPDPVQSQLNCRIGTHYPLPIVEHSLARQRTLSAYAQAKASHS